VECLTYVDCYLKKKLCCVCWCASFLLAKRQDTRLVEIAVKIFLRPVIWMFPTFMTIPVETVA